MRQLGDRSRRRDGNIKRAWFDAAAEEDVMGGSAEGGRDV
jgi:hypothetical protein